MTLGRNFERPARAVLKNIKIHAKTIAKFILCCGDQKSGWHYRQKCLCMATICALVELARVQYARPMVVDPGVAGARAGWGQD